MSGNRRKARYTKGGETDSKNSVATMDFFKSHDLTAQEKNFIFRNTLETINPITGAAQSYGQLFDYFKDPSNRPNVDKFLKSRKHRGSRTVGIDKFLNEAFSESKGKFLNVAKDYPKDIVISPDVINEIYKNRTEFQNFVLPESQGTLEEEFKPVSRRYDEGGNMRKRSMQGGGKFGDFLKKNADFLTGIGGMTSNIIGASNLETEQTPVLARHKRSQFKSTLPETTAMNQAQFQGLLDNLNQYGASAATTAGAYAKSLGATNEAVISDTQMENQFNLGQDRLSAGVALANTQTLNRVDAANLTRRNQRTLAQTSAVGAGLQDFINILGGRQVQNMQSKGLMLEALKSGDTEVLERVAESMGLSVEDFIQILGDPNESFGGSKRGGGRRNRGGNNIGTIQPDFIESNLNIT